MLGWSSATFVAVGLGAGGLLAVMTMAGVLGRMRRVLTGLEDGVRRDELGALVHISNDLGDTLRAERRDIVQRELLLDTLLHGVPVATVLVAASDRVVFSNRTARQLLHGGRRLEGHRFAEIIARGPPELAYALSSQGEPMFSVTVDGSVETFKAERRTFELGGQAHTLFLLERLTPELRRREVEAWKNAVRVVNHELNNSLAPVRSLAHSARRALERPEHRHRLEEMLQTIEERVAHLAAFLSSYAALARLPPAQATGRLGRVAGPRGSPVPVHRRAAASGPAGPARSVADGAGAHQPGQERARVGQRGRRGRRVGARGR
jgi:hypothetical protein